MLANLLNWANKDSNNKLLFTREKAVPCILWSFYEITLELHSICDKWISARELEIIGIWECGPRYATDEFINSS